MFAVKLTPGGDIVPGRNDLSTFSLTQTSNLKPQTSNVKPQTSILKPQTCRTVYTQKTQFITRIYQITAAAVSGYAALKYLAVHTLKN